MNLGEIQQYVWDYFDLSATDISANLIATWANQGQRQVLASRPRWAHLEVRYTFTTTAGTSEYAVLPSDVRSISAADCDDTGALAVVDEAEAKARYWRGPDSTFQNRPQAISRWTSGKVRVWPEPDGIYDIDLLGYRAPTLMSAASHDPDTPSELHDAVLDWVMQRACMHQEDLTQAAAHGRLFEATVARYGPAEDHDDDARPLILGGGFGQTRRPQHASEEHWVPGLGDLSF